jgi:hypothetical protein
LIAIPKILDEKVKLFTQEGNIESFKYLAMNPSQELVVIPPVIADSLVSPPTTVNSSI